MKLCGSRPVCCVLGTGPQLPGVMQKPGPWCLRAEGLIFKYSSAHIKSFEGGYAFHTTKWTHFERNRLSFEKWVPCLSTVMTEMQVARSSLAHPGPKQMFFLLFCHCRLVFAFLKSHLYGIVRHVLSGVRRSSLCACFEFIPVAVCVRDALFVPSSVARLDTLYVNSFTSGWAVGRFLVLAVVTDASLNVTARASCGRMCGHPFLLGEYQGWNCCLCGKCMFILVRSHPPLRS